jgi:hypothetical protein
MSGEMQLRGPGKVPQGVAEGGGNRATRPAELRLHVTSDWSEVARVNAEVMQFLASLGLSADAVDRHTMVVCELVENGIKYGHFARAVDEVLVHLTVSGGIVSVQVTNPISPVSLTNLGTLDQTIQWVRGYQAPFEAFIARLKAISNEPLNALRSCLGLIRITYEGRALLDFYMEENEMVSVSAVASVE